MEKETKEYFDSVLKQFRKNLIIAVLPLSAVCIISIITGAYYVFFNTNTVVSPPFVTDTYTVSRSSVDKSYLSQMSRYVLNLRYSVDPTSCENNFNSLLHFVDDSAESNFGKWHGKLKKECHDIKKYKISSTIYIKKIYVNTSELKVTIPATMHKFVDGRSLKPSQVDIEIKWNLNYGIRLVYIKKKDEK